MESAPWTLSHETETGARDGVTATDVRAMLDHAFDVDEDTDDEDTVHVSDEIPQERSKAVPATSRTPPSGLRAADLALVKVSAGLGERQRALKVQRRGDLDTSAKLPFAGRLISGPKLGRQRDDSEARFASPRDLPKPPSSARHGGAHSEGVDLVPLTPGRIVTLQDLQHIVHDIDYGHLEVRLRGGPRSARTGSFGGPTAEAIVIGEEAVGEEASAGGPLHDMYGGRADDEDELVAMAQVCAGGCRFVQLPGVSAFPSGGDPNAVRPGGCLDMGRTSPTIEEPPATSRSSCRPPSVASSGPPTALPAATPHVGDAAWQIAPEDDVLAGLDVFVEGAGDELLSYVFGSELEPLPEKAGLHIDSV